MLKVQIFVPTGDKKCELTMDNILHIDFGVCQVLKDGVLHRHRAIKVYDIHGHIMDVPAGARVEVRLEE